MSLATNVSIPKEKLPKDLVCEGHELDSAKNEYKLLSDGKLWISGSLLPTTPNVLFKITTRVKLMPETNTILTGYVVAREHID